jgi:hypothetical protein
LRLLGLGAGLEQLFFLFVDLGDRNVGPLRACYL